MGEKVALRFNEIANLVTRLDPTMLDKLAQASPTMKIMLQAGELMGDESSAESEKVKVLLQVASVALAAGETEVTRAIESAKSRISRADTWKHAAEIFSIVFSGSTVGLLLVAEQDKATVTSAGAALASIATLASDRLLRMVDPQAGNVRSHYLKLVGLREQARMLERQGRIQIAVDASLVAVLPHVNTVNALCAELNEQAQLII